MKKSLLIFLLLHCLIQSASSQDFLINQYNNKSYHANQLIWDAAEDLYGRIWFANNKGLLRFDGSSWVLFSTPNPVRRIAFGTTGELFVACQGDFGMLKFNTNGTSEYISLKKQLGANNQIAGGDERVQIVGDEIYFSMQSQLVKAVKINKNYRSELFKIAEILGAFTDGKCLYVNSAKYGLSVFNKGKLDVVTGGEQLAGKQIVNTFPENNEIIIASAYDGIFLLKNKTISKINGTVSRFAQKGIVAITKLKDNRIAIGTLHDGVKIFTLSKANGLDIVENYALKLPSPEIYSLYVDKENNLWVGHAKGLSHVLLGLPVKQFPNLTFSGYATDMQLVGKKLYISSTSGLYVLDTEMPEALIPVNGIGECWDLYEEKGVLMVATTNGLFQVTEKCAKVLFPAEIFLHIQKGNLSKAIYALGPNGYLKNNNEKSLFGAAKLNGLTQSANSILEWQNTVIWFGTYHNGLFNSGLKNNDLPPPLSNGEVLIRLKEGNPIFQTKEAVYTYDGKIFNENKDLSKIFVGSKNNDFAFGKDFWVFTDDELRQVQNNTLMEQSTAYCILGKPTALCEDNKNLWVAFEDKIYLVESSELTSKKIKASINKLTYGRSKTGFSGFYIDKNGELSEKQEVIPEVNYEENSLRIEFGVNSFITPSKNLFSYKIDGLNEDWSDWKNESYLDLNGLSGGNYCVHLKARNAAGQISEEGEFNFKIIPPFYLSGVAFLVYCCIFILLMYGIILLNNKRLVSKNEQLEKVVNERTHELKETQSQLVQQEKLASLGALTAGIAHEIKNPLNFVNNFAELSNELLEELKTAPNEEEKNEIIVLLQQNLEKINHHGKRADGIVKSMLEHSRTGTGVKHLTDLNKLCEEYLNLAYHGMRANIADFNCAIEKNFAPNLPQVNMVQQDISRVILNLINNAFYAIKGKPDGKLLITTQIKNNFVSIHIKDNGIGMPQEVKQKIFEPFFTTKPSGQGTGLGLSLSFDIIQAHGGKIEVQSEVEKGTEFIITLPV